MGADSRKSRLERLGLLVYIAIVCWVAVYSFRHPSYNWDLIGYVAAIESIDHKSAAAIRRATYDELDGSLPPDQLHELKYDGGYRQAVFEHPEYLVQQIPFYSIKPGYLAVLYGLHKTGLSIPRAAVLVAIASYLAICALIWRWAARRIEDRRLSFGLSTLLALARPLALTAGLTTPDALSSALVFFGLYLILELPLTGVGLCVLLASNFVRTDNLIICLLVSVLIISRRRSWKILFRTSAFAVLCTVVVKLINSLTGNYGWRTLVYQTFVAPLPNPDEVRPDLTTGMYAKLLLSGLSSIHYSYAIAMFLFLIGGAIALRAAGHRLAWGPGAQGTVLITASMLLHFLLFPVFWDRYLLGHYLAFVFMSTRLLKESATAHVMTHRLVPMPEPSSVPEAPSPQSLPVA